MILHGTEAGEGLPLVLLHGLFGSARNFASVQRQFARRFRCIALDLRNHGASPHDPAMSYEAMADDVLDTLAGRAALPAMVLGHSMGGKVAMRLALERPDAARRLIVADIAPVPYKPAFRELAAALQALPLTPGLTRAAADAQLAVAIPDAGLRAFLLQNLRIGERPGWRMGLREIASALPMIEGWEARDGAIYRGPTLYIAGARSDYIRPEHRPAIGALFPAARFVTVKDAGHWIHAENPVGFVGVVEGFLSK